MCCSAVGCMVMLILSLFAALLAAEAQPAGKIYRLGILSPVPVPAPSVATIPNLTLSPWPSASWAMSRARTS